MLSKKLETAINKQVNAEIYSGYMYYSMAAYFESLGLKGFAHWMRVQTLEEFYHAQKFVTYLQDRGASAVMKPIDGPPTKWKSPLDAFKAVYEHETKVTAMINALVDLAIKESDHATKSFLNWYVDEQVEEEASADEVIQKLKLVDNTKGGLFMLDKELDARTFTLPVDLTGKF